jgi:hypothetical protein
MRAQTPGPWEWREGWLFHSDKQAMSSRTVLLIHEDKWCPTADDADLIAAAPDLLEALRDLVLYHDVPDAAQDPVVVPLLKAAFAAIAKAEGRS